MSKPKTFRPWTPEQTLLLPPSPVEWLPANQLVFFLLDLAAELNLSAIYAVYEARDPRGVKAYEPRMMVVLLLYAYRVGIPSSRRIERAWLGGCRLLSADAEAAAAADSDEADAESEAAAWALAKEAQQAERRAKAARGRAELARRLAIDKAQVAGLSTPDPLISVDPLAMPSRNLPTTAAGVPKANAQRNHRCAEGSAYTDPHSHILKGGDGWIQGYNCQAAVDGAHQIIVAVGVSNQAADQHHFVPMMERIVANTGQLPEKLIAAAGYCSTSNIEASEQCGLDARGLDRFLLRGLEKVDGEWTLMAITHSIGKLHRASLAAS
jgi:hypothetical protein